MPTALPGPVKVTAPVLTPPAQFGSAQIAASMPLAAAVLAADLAKFPADPPSVTPLIAGVLLLPWPETRAATAMRFPAVVFDVNENAVPLVTNPLAADWTTAMATAPPPARRERWRNANGPALCQPDGFWQLAGPGSRRSESGSCGDPTRVCS